MKRYEYKYLWREESADNAVKKLNEYGKEVGGLFVCSNLFIYY